ncbi:MAG TPA: Gfo/Idh/MocA family oxidoreductase [Pelolinea sp.]|nr:Gfo/Idh/MocA family oxidoreductase [Pelolinea sp.]
MKFLIAGLGSIGRRHLRNLVELGESDILLYRTHQSTLPDDDLNQFIVETDLYKALEQKPDAVIISNPTVFHMDIAIPAAKAGCGLFVEKPLAHHTDDLFPLEDILNTKKNRFFSAFQFRFNPGLRKVKEILDSRMAGRPYSFNACWGEYFPDWHPWEDYRSSYAARKDLGGGVVLTLCHPLDYLRWMFGDPVELYAVTGNASDLELEVEDFADVLIQFGEGVSGSLHLDYYRRDKKQDLEIVCADGTIYWEYSSSIVTVIFKDGERKVFPAPEGYERNTMFLDEMAHFLEILKGSGSPVCTYEDGKRAMEFAWGIIHSGRYQQRVIFG